MGWGGPSAATGNDYQKDRQFQKINSEKDSIDVAVVRGGKQLVVPNTDILVGEVMLLSTGDKVCPHCPGCTCCALTAHAAWHPAVYTARQVTWGGS